MDNIRDLQSILTKRARQAQRKARWYLFSAIIALGLGVAGIIFAPEFILRDREKLQTETQRLVEIYVDQINTIGRELAQLEDLLNRSTLWDADISPDGQVGIAVGDEGTILITYNGGRTWRRQNSDIEQMLFGVTLNFSGEMGIAVGAEGTILTTYNGGRTWRRQNSGTKLSLVDVALSTNGTWAVSVGHRGTILTTLDGGISWNKQIIVEAQNHNLLGIALNPSGVNGIAVGTSSCST